MKGVNRAAISALVNKYIDLIKKGRLSEFSEADVGSKFILPLFQALGWDTGNIDEVKEQRRTLTGPVDYSMRIKGAPKYVVEIKRFTEDLDGKRVIRGKEESYPFQATRYAWHLKVDWCVLTNFRELRLYYAHTQRPNDGLVYRLYYNHYAVKDFENLILLSKESVAAGKLDTLEKRRTRNDVDREILDNLYECRKRLVESTLKHNPNLSLSDVRECVQKILDRILVIRVAEDRTIIGTDSLWRELESWRMRGLPTPFMRSLKSLFRDFDEIYNSKLFEPHMCEDLRIDNEALEFMLSDKALYAYNFDLIDSDVLGAIYEDYIGHVLSQGDEGVEIVSSKAIRKRRGIYYTPTYVVDYIVEEAVGKALSACKTPEQVSKIKILDPACGSGSFLIKAFDSVKEWYDDYDKRMKKEVEWYRIAQVEKVEAKILTQNLFGVDVDPQAAEISSVNLMLKVLRKGEKVPEILGKNVRIGNSLVSHEDVASLSFKPSRPTKPFDWSSFDFFRDEDATVIVIGNPPYVGIETIPDEDKKIYREIYPTFEYRSDVFSLFLERMIRLLRPGDLCAFIIPSRLLNNNSYVRLRRLMLSETAIEQIVQLGTDVFKNVKNETMILILRKWKEPLHKENYVRVTINVKDLPNKEYESYSIPQKLFENTYKNMFNIRLKSQIIELFEKMKAVSFPLSDIAVANQGMRTGDNVNLIVTEKKNDKYKPIVRGKDVERYFIGFPDLYVNYDPEVLDAPRDERIFNSREKLIVQEIRNINLKRRVIAGYDGNQYYALQTTNVINMVSDTSYSTKYLLAILNSKLINFYFRILWIDIHIKSEYLEQIPIPRIDFESEGKVEHDELVDLVHEMVELKTMLNNITDEFERYWEPIEDEVSLKNFYDKLDVSDREIVDPRSRGTIRRVDVQETSDWIVLFADFYTQMKGRRKQFEKVPILRCRFKNEYLRKFLFYVVLRNKKKLGTGNVSSKILTIPVPRFHKNARTNLEAITKIMKSFLKAVRQKEELEGEIQKVDSEIDKRVYGLYGLTKKEIAIVESQGT